MPEQENSATADDLLNEAATRFVSMPNAHVLRKSGDVGAFLRAIGTAPVPALNETAFLFEKAAKHHWTGMTTPDRDLSLEWPEALKKAFDALKDAKRKFAAQADGDARAHALERILAVVERILAATPTTNGKALDDLAKQTKKLAPKPREQG